MLAQSFDFQSMSPGVYDISNDDYHKSNGISRSGIQEFKRSPLHYWHHYLNPNRPPKKQKAAFEFGKPFHVLVLEHHLFEQQYVVAPKLPGRNSGAGKAAWAAFEAEHYGKNIVTQEDYDAMRGMVNSILKNSTARALIENAQYEQSIYYADQDSGLLCKSRPDILHPNFLADLKTTKDARWSAFERGMDEYGYPIQAAMQVDAGEYIYKNKMDDFIIIAVEKEPPYALAVYPMDFEIIERGRMEYRKYLLDMKECFKSNHWPSYESRVISLPAYIKNRAI